jgi:hypothetical protein
LIASAEANGIELTTDSSRHSWVSGGAIDDMFRPGVQVDSSVVPRVRAVTMALTWR